MAARARGVVRIAIASRFGWQSHQGGSRRSSLLAFASLLSTNAGVTTAWWLEAERVHDRTALLVSYSRDASECQVFNKMEPTSEATRVDSVFVQLAKEYESMVSLSSMDSVLDEECAPAVEATPPNQAQPGIDVAAGQSSLGMRGAACCEAFDRMGGYMSRALLAARYGVSAVQRTA